MRIGIIGRTGTLIYSSEALRKKGHEISFIMTCRSESFYDKNENDFEIYASHIGVPFYNTLTPDILIDEIIILKTDICISINWLTILSDEFLSIFKYGVLNAHAGDLPRFKGNACPNWAILKFEKKIALTIHKMVVELDSGPYLLKSYMNIDEYTYINDIYTWIEKKIPQMFVNSLDLLNTQGFIEQDKNIKTLRTYPRIPEDSRINWATNRKDIIALIRASSKPLDGAFCFLNGTDIKVTIYRATNFDIEFDYYAIPGQVCMKFNESPVVATKDGLIVIEDCTINELNHKDSKSYITKSLRNRLT